MNRKIYCTLFAAALTAGPFLAGCEETVSKETQTKVKDDGTVIKKEDTVTKSSDGTVTHTESKKVDKNNNDRDGASIKVDVDK
jgi:hypothetical protein